MRSADSVVQEALDSYVTADIESDEEAIDEIAELISERSTDGIHPRHRLQEILALAYAGLRASSVLALAPIPFCQPYIQMMRPTPKAVPVVQQQGAR